MKKLLLSVGMIGMLLLTGCEAKPDMYIEPVKMSKSEEQLLELVGYGMDSMIYDYQLQDSIESFVIRRLDLDENQNWVEVGRGEFLVEEDVLSGRFSIGGAQSNERFTFGLKNKTTIGSGNMGFPITGSSQKENTDLNLHTLSNWKKERIPMQKGKEVPVYLRGTTESNKVQDFSVDWFYDTDKLVESYDNLHAITILFE